MGVIRGVFYRWKILRNAYPTADWQTWAILGTLLHGITRKRMAKMCQVRLDRATCNNSFMAMFPDTMVENIITEESDHMAILIRVMETAPIARAKGARPFQYEEMWSRHEGYEQMVAEAWQAAGRANGIAGVCGKLSQVTRSMHAWGRAVFGSIKRQISRLKNQLRDAKERSLVTGYTQEVRGIESQLKEIYEREEVMYKQRSRVGWLKEGDQNTQYF